MPTPKEQPKKLAVSKVDAALMMSISKRSLERLMALGKIRYTRAVQKVLIPVSEIERFLSVGGKI